MQRTQRTRPIVGLLAAALFAPWPAAAADEVARVIGLLGEAVAQTPGEAPRTLDTDAPIFAGDQLVTSAGAGLGLLAGTHYVGLDESTTATLRVADTGAPALEVAAGRARLLASDDSAAGRLGTNSLVAVDAGIDTEVFAFPEKAGLISMICPNEGTVTASRGPQALASSTGGCSVAKAGEALYPARAGHAPLAMLATPQGFQLAGDPGLPLPPVALGIGPVALFDAGSPGPFSNDPRLPCDGITCIDPVVPGLVPVANPPTNPPIPGMPPP